MELINKYLSGAVLPVTIMIFAIVFAIILKGMPFSKPKKVFSILFGKENTEGEGSGLRAVIFALAGTLGVGNIVGVASAIALGGPGAVFWMWISAVLAMILKYCEVTLAILHRRKRAGEYYGGAMYYMTDYFNSCKKHLIGIIFSSLFVFFCVLNAGTMGCMIQANAISESFNMTFGYDRKSVGIFISLISIIVFLFNGKRLFAICEKLIPIVSILYIGMCLLIIFLSPYSLIDSLGKIINNSFSFESVGGGFLGFLSTRAIRFGTVRGLFSNEAGCGTSPIAHATSKTKLPCKQGILGMIEVFIDTIVLCTMTAFVILKNEDLVSQYSSQPMLMVMKAFERELGEGASAILSICVFLFAFATIICWGYYGRECLFFLKESKAIEKSFYIIYVILIFVGSFIKMEFVWEIADFVIAMMTLMNLYSLWKMRFEIKRETYKFFKKKELPNRSSKG